MPITRQPSGGGTDWSRLTPSAQNVFDTDITSYASNATKDILTVTGKGIMSDFRFAWDNNNSAVNFGISLIIDGVELSLHSSNATNSYSIYEGGYLLPQGNGSGSTTSLNNIIALSSPISFKSSVIVRIKNIFTNSVAKPRCVARAVLHM